MRERSSIFNKSGEHVATIGLNDSGLWQLVIIKRKELEFFCPTKELAFAAWFNEFDPETGFPRTGG